MEIRNDFGFNAELEKKRKHRIYVKNNRKELLKAVIDTTLAIVFIILVYLVGYYTITQ